MRKGSGNRRVSLHEEISAVAHHLFERNGRVEGHDLDNWLEAERIVRTLRKIAGEDSKRYVVVNIPKTRDVKEQKMRF